MILHGRAYKAFHLLECSIFAGEALRDIRHVHSWSPPHCLTKDAELWRHVLLSCSALSVSQYPQGVWSKRSFSSPQEERYPPSDVTISYIYLYLLFYYALKLHIFYLFDIFFFNYFFFVALKAEQCCLTACSLAQSTNAYHGTHNEGYTC